MLRPTIESIEPRCDDAAGGRSLADLEAAVAQMFAMTREGLLDATRGLLTGDRETAARLLRHDTQLDSLCVAIEASAMAVLTSSPAPDSETIRFLVLLMQIAPEIERSGDLAEHIAARASQDLCTHLTSRGRFLVSEMGRVSAEMWHDAAVAYADRNGGAAATLRRRDDEPDDLHVRLTEEVAAGGMSPAAAVELGLVARFLERLGDHAVNIVQRVHTAASP